MMIKEISKSIKKAIISYIECENQLLQIDAIVDKDKIVKVNKKIKKEMRRHKRKDRNFFLQQIKNCIKYGFTIDQAIKEAHSIMRTLYRIRKIK